MNHPFTAIIKDILRKNFNQYSEDIFQQSLLLQYINLKTKSANKGSKARSSFANLYAIYVIVEDYINGDFETNGMYSKYEGAQFSSLFRRQRELPFGSALQNHALNNRMNAEFAKFFPTVELVPIIRNLQTNRYWFNENLLKLSIDGLSFNIAKSVIEIIDAYVAAKQDSFKRFITHCEMLQNIGEQDASQIYKFILELLAPNVDARLFEIVSFSILKSHYKEQSIYWGYDIDNLVEEELHLYKTGKTNANDGGIDFVMKPLGRFFQVTETLDFKKYFLDIEKIEKYPITFVVKSTEDVESLKTKLYQDALKTYVIESVVKKYLACIEEIINIPILMEYYKEINDNGLTMDVLNEIIIQSKVEFNYEDED